MASREGSVSDNLRTATNLLSASSDTPRLDAELLMAHALGIERQALLLDPVLGPLPHVRAECQPQPGA